MATKANAHDLSNPGASTLISRRQVLIGGSAALGLCFLPRGLARADAPSSFIVDAHCHAFNAHDVPVEGFLERLAIGTGIPAFIVSLLRGYFGELGDTARSLAPDDYNELLILDGMKPWDPDAHEPPKPIPEPTGPALMAKAVAAAGHPELRGAAGFGPETYSLIGSLGNDEDALAAVLQVRAKKDPELERWLSTHGAPRASHVSTPKSSLEMQALLGSDSQGWLARVFESIAEGLKHGVAFVGRIQTSRLRIAQQIAEAFPDVGLFTPALVDFDVWASGQSAPVTMARQVEIQEKLSALLARGKLLRKNRVVAFHGYVGFNPYKEAIARPEYAQLSDASADDQFRAWDAEQALASGRPFDVVRHAVERRGFIGVKLYPPTGFVPADNASDELKKHPLAKDTRRSIDRALQRLYRWCDQKCVPILVHTNQSNAFAPEYDTFSRPDRWIPVLERYGNLHVSLGHFGIGAESKVNGRKRKWSDVGAEVAHRFSGRVWFDLSNSETPMKPEKVDRICSAVAVGGDEVRRRLLYGTDFYMCDLVGDVQGYRERLEKQLKTEAKLAVLGPDFSRRFFGENALVFLGLRTDAGDRVDATQEGNRKRLLAWYQGKGLNTPEWI